MNASYFSRLAAIAASALVWLSVVGCGGPAKTKMDTSELVTAFGSADAAIKTQVESAAKALNAGNLRDGTAALATMAKASHESLTEAQKTALMNVVTTIQTIMAEDSNKMDMKVYQSADDILAGMEGRESTKVGITPDMLRSSPAPAE
ncbi:MAG: hypothetical protein JNL97_11780 [Verrucomicrobiales bacterium]|nr:hypothetical protein [Verrucomicrobiales bacterium]